MNIDNDAVNKIRNQLTGEFGAVPDVARNYKASKSYLDSDMICLLNLQKD